MLIFQVIQPPRSAPSHLTHFPISSASLYPAKAACFSATTFAALVYPAGNSRAGSSLVPLQFPMQIRLFNRNGSAFQAPFSWSFSCLRYVDAFGL